MKFLITEQQLQLLSEHKFWGLSNEQFLSWMQNKKGRTFIFTDSETSGLLGGKIEQLTQIGAIATTYNGSEFNTVDTFNKKIKLTDQIKKRMKEPNSRVKWVLGFNHYGQKNAKYHDEYQTLKEFKDWIDKYDNPILVIQNAYFDMNMFNLRYEDIKFKYEVLDTKQVIQLFFLPTLQKLAEKNDKYKHIIEKIGTSSRDNGLINSSMGKIGPVLKLDMTNYHDALKDCEITIGMLKKILNFLKLYKDENITNYQAERIKTIR